MFENVLPYFLTNDVKVLGQELIVSSLFGHEYTRVNHGYSFIGATGRYDCFAFVNGTPTVIDFKTSKVPKTKHECFKYFAQTAFYACSLARNAKIELDKIDVAILISNHGSSSGTFYTEKAIDYIKLARLLIETYYNKYTGSLILGKKFKG
jgi:hypothetical protein